VKDSKILIIQTAFIGDVILTTPLLNTLFRSVQGITIDFLTTPASAGLIETNPAIREVLIYDKRGRDRGLAGIRKMAGELRKRAYDLCICPHRSLRSAYLAYRSGAELRIGFNTSSWRGAFSHIVPYREDIHEIERNLSLLNPLDIPVKLENPSVFPDENDRKVVEAVLAETSGASSDRLFAVAPGSVWPTKRWPAENYADFCRQLAAIGLKPVLIGSSNDDPLCRTISGLAGSALNYAGKFTLRQTAYLLTKCHGLLTNDSAPLHLGMAADIPVFAIFGPTVPGFGFAPFGEHGFVIERKDVGCRPCGIHGGKKCPVKTFACMELITPGEVFKKVQPYFAS
jgi:heptosyltransferase-2